LRVELAILHEEDYNLDLVGVDDIELQRLIAQSVRSTEPDGAHRIDLARASLNSHTPMTLLTGTRAAGSRAQRVSVPQ
jgi:hypothetical protein